ncbi:MAG: hypothetical protein R3E32_14015 [Chitinophagales bacterium]
MLSERLGNNPGNENILKTFAGGADGNGGNVLIDAWKAIKNKDGDIFDLMDGWETKKFRDFYEDLRNKEDFRLGIFDNPKLVDTWDFLDTKLPTNLRHYAADLAHVKFFQDNDVKYALNWIKSEQPKLFDDYPDLTPGAIVSLNYYSTTSGYQINFWLRELPILPEHMSKWTEEHANNVLRFLDEAFEKLPTYNTSSMLLRLDSRSPANEVNLISTGKQLNYPHFISTTKSKLSSFLQPSQNMWSTNTQDFIFEVSNPNSIKIIDFQPFSRANKEYEVLCIRGKKLNILNDGELKPYPVPSVEEMISSPVPNGEIPISAEEAEDLIHLVLDEWRISKANPNAIPESQLGAEYYNSANYQKASKILTFSVEIIDYSKANPNAIPESQLGAEYYNSANYQKASKILTFSVEIID